MDNEETGIIFSIIEILILWRSFIIEKNECLYSEQFQW